MKRLKKGNIFHKRIALIVISLVVILIRFINFPRDDKVLFKIFNLHSIPSLNSVTKPGIFLLSSKYNIQGIVKDDPLIDGISSKFTLEITKINGQEIKGSHLILVKTDDLKIQYGDEINIKAIVKKPEKIINPDGRTFDYPSYLARSNIFYIVNSLGKDKLSGEPNTIVLSEGHGNNIFSALYGFKKNFVSKINRILPSPHAFLANGLIVTGKATLSKEMQTQFQKVGLIHIVVLSGYNITIVGESIARLFYFLPTLASAMLGAIAIILFSVMTGGGSTVIRATIMSLIGLYARISGRQNSALVSLIFTGLLMLMWNPMIAIYDPSFQMSFAATLGLILYSKPIENFLAPTAKKLRIPYWILLLVSSALSTQLFTLPLIMYLSGLVSLIALPVNILVLPFVPFTMFFVFATGLFGFILPVIAVIPAFVSYMLLAYELKVVYLASSLGFASITLPPVPTSIILLLYSLLTFIGAKAYINAKNENKIKPKNISIEGNSGSSTIPKHSIFQYEKTPP